MVLPTLEQLLQNGIDGTKAPISVRDTAEFRVQCGIYHALFLLCQGSAFPPPPPVSPPGQGAPSEPEPVVEPVVEPTVTWDKPPMNKKPFVPPVKNLKKDK